VLILNLKFRLPLKITKTVLKSLIKLYLILKMNISLFYSRFSSMKSQESILQSIILTNFRSICYNSVRRFKIRAWIFSLKFRLPIAKLN